MNIVHFNIYRNPNIGVFIRSNDNSVLSPPGISANKIQQMKTHLKVSNITTSIGGSNLLGALSIMNNNGIIESKLIENYEINILSKETGLNIQKLNSRFTAVGNLITANDYGGIVSSLVSEEQAKEISKSLKVPVKRMEISNKQTGFSPIYLIGAMINTTNKGAIAHPIINKDEMKIISEILQVEVENATVNSGVPYDSSGIISNSKNILVGSQTSGPELVMLSRAFGI